MIEVVSNSLAWTLIHSLWVALVIWIIFSAFIGQLKQAKWRSAVRVIGLICFIFVTWTIVWLEASSLMTQKGEIALWIAFESAPSENSPLTMLKDWININSIIISGLWLAGLVIGLAKYLMGMRQLRTYRRTATDCHDQALLEEIDRIRKGLGVVRKVRVLISSLIDSPITVGVLRPVIYLPIGLTSGFTWQEVETLLYHEMMHIKRYDYLINLLLVCLETLFFFNPIVLLMVRELRQEMEFASDEGVLMACERQPYLEALIRLQENNLSGKLALAAKNKNSEFRKRLEQIINKKDMMNRKKGISGLVPRVVLLMAVLAMMSTAFMNKPEENLNNAEEPLELVQQQKQDTLRAKDGKELRSMLKEVHPDDVKNTVVFLDGKQTPIIIKPMGDALVKADKMMDEIQSELVKDGILTEERTKITLMFQYSDVLNGKDALGEKYEKYKNILNRYFPVYDSFATTRVFRF